MSLFAKVISGGQTGADRAALDFAIAKGIPHGGWCPSGRIALDGRIPSKYQLEETRSSGYLQRNEFNVRDADATVIFTLGRLNQSRGSMKTAEFSTRLAKPFVHISPGQEAADTLFDLLLKIQPCVLNVAGSRGDGTGTIESFVTGVLEAVWIRGEDQT